ncbi:hypothetical protein HDU82_007242 [Entophlyctis luteolus]|nr:hypothetical protein HDU82_007242 [Entophlyctis luteolus]
MHNLITCTPIAAFYTTQHILKGASTPVAVDLYEKLPIPFGLARYGIAPDHSDAKKAIHKFDQLLTEDPRIRFVGNVCVGRDVSVSALRSAYHAVVLAYGAEAPKSLGLRHETTTKGVYTAHDFVKWVNGYPARRGAKPFFDMDLAKVQTAVIVGQGNVALDVARLLLTPPDSLKHTDIADGVVNALQKSSVKRVHIVGRRGPFQLTPRVQMAFTAKELREVTKMPGVKFAPNSVLQQIPYKSLDASLDRGPKRLMEILHSIKSFAGPGEKSWSLDWYLSPQEIFRNEADAISGIRFQQMQPLPNFSPLGVRTQPAAESFVDLGCDLLISSLGYKGERLDDNDVPFDSEKKVIPNSMGRVLGNELKTIPGLYASGWIKRGAVGVIAATMYDAIETAECVLQDMGSLVQGEKPGFEAVLPDLSRKGICPVFREDWTLLDAFEREQGEKMGKERAKIVDLSVVSEILRK